MPRMPKQRSAHYAPEPVEEKPIRINPKTIKVRKVTPKNQRQVDVLDSVQENDLTFVLGTAGTGKSYLVVYAALLALVEGEVDRIVISRPAVDAGESIGFIPGPISEKMDPYLRPLFDALREMVGPNVLQHMKDQNLVEILPFAYMRGTSLKNSFIVLDEVQNATPDQLKTALTRIGEGSVCVVTADPGQIDLIDKTCSSVLDMQRFRSVKGIGFVEFLPQDVIRSRIVRLVLDCYTT